MAQSVSFIGSGNAATNLAGALENAGIVVNEVYSRNPDHAAKLVSRLYQATVLENVDFRESSSDIFIISVRDEVVPSVVKGLVIPSEESIVAHTSGTLSMDLLSDFPNRGVFYPLQTLTSEKILDFADVPLLIEGSDSLTEKALVELAGSLSNQVLLVDSEIREQVHLAAVFASNFSNHMIRIAHELLYDLDLDLEILSPLILETIRKSLESGPHIAQTGPARRKDIQVLNQHLKRLKDEPELAMIYKKISEHIIKKFS